VDYAARPVWFSIRIHRGGSSFWTKSIRFTRFYSKHGQFWFAARTQSVTEALIFGKTNVTISYFGYDGKSDSIDNPAPEPGIEQERVSVGP
jgi:hypothetical protein